MTLSQTGIMVAIDEAAADQTRYCSRCIYDANTPAITFDEDGVCNYCHMIDQLAEEYGTGTPRGKQLFQSIVADIKRKGKRRQYDCIVGVSGGTDSSYLLAKAVEWGLRPLAVHYDNTWNSSIATENIRKVTSKLKVDLYTHVVDNRESDDIFRAFFRSGVPDLDCATDIGFAETHYRAAAQTGVRYVLEGHSFTTEGVSPLGCMYMDGRYIADIHRRFGTTRTKTFPNMGFWRFLYWVMIKRFKKIRPLWYLSYSKQHAREYLESEFGWEYYGGHHLENRMSAYYHSVYCPDKFGIDNRNNSLSAAVRSGELDREEALLTYQTGPDVDPDLIEYFKKRLALSDQEYEETMNGPRKTYRDYRTYKTRFERLRPLFYVLAKYELVPKSFYIKYTSKAEI